MIQDKIQIIMNPYFICALTKNHICPKGRGQFSGTAGATGTCIMASGLFLTRQNLIPDTQRARLCRSFGEKFPTGKDDNSRMDLEGSSQNFRAPNTELDTVHVRPSNKCPAFFLLNPPHCSISPCHIKRSQCPCF